MRLYLDKNYLIFIINENYFRLLNPFLHLNFLIDKSVLDILTKIENYEVSEIIIKYTNQSFEIEETTTFNLFDNMYNNPDFINNKNIKIKNKKKINELINFLQLKKILSSKKNIKYNLKKNNFFERFKGNINEQIGYECFLSKVDIKDWWIKQKFKNDKLLKETPYKFIQEEFLQNYFKKNINNSIVLEIASGNGFWCNKMARYAKKVYGIDYEKDYIKRAKKNYKNKKLVFYNYDITDNKLNQKINVKFDYIFIIDFFLFLFDKKFQKNLYLNKKLILKTITKFLSKKGKILIVDPHFFWLTPQIGNLNNPIGLITEYKNRYFKTTPTLSEATKLFYDSGLLIKRIYEPQINHKYYFLNKERYNFMREFPQWIVYELEQNK